MILKFPGVHISISPTMELGNGPGSSSSLHHSPWLCLLEHPSFPITLLSHSWRRHRKMCHMRHGGPACKALGTQKPLKLLNNFNSERISANWWHFCLYNSFENFMGLHWIWFESLLVDKFFLRHAWLSRFILSYYWPLDCNAVASLRLQEPHCPADRLYQALPSFFPRS